MSDFLKCNCLHCGQNIEYPSEGTGETVPCPTCEKPVLLTPAVDRKASYPANSQIPPTGDTPIKQDSYVARVRAEPATDKQKEKLSYFGCALDEKISKGEASDALDKCVREFPEKEWAYYNRPATKEQLAELRKINKHPDCGPDEPFYDFENEGLLTYGKAKDLIQDWAGLREQKYWEEEKAYQNSDEARIDEACRWLDMVREVKRKQVAQAWAVVKSRMTDTSQQPDLTEVEDTMEELFPDFRKTAQDRVTYQCKHCGGFFKARYPSISARNHSSPIYFTEADKIQITIPCPSCGRDKNVFSLNVCKYICPNCSKECLVLKSQTGQPVTHSGSEGCNKDFFAAPKEPSTVKPTIRVMQYVGQPLERVSSDAPTWEQLQKIKEIELKLDPKAGITASQLDELLKLEDQPPRAEDLELFARRGIPFYAGDAFSTYAGADLVRCFEKMHAERGDYTNISMAAAAASSDPALKKATITLDQSGQLVFRWPKRKLEQWYRKGAKY